MRISKILWPTDLSKAASKAQPYVTSLSETYGAEVHLLYVAEDLSHFEHYWGSGPDSEHIRELRDYEMKIARERLEELCRNHLSGCPRYHIHIHRGEPAQEILKTVDEVDADLIVMASRGMKNIFPFGSVAERVIKNSPVPVFTINPAAAEG